MTRQHSPKWVARLVIVMLLASASMAISSPANLAGRAPTIRAHPGDLASTGRVPATVPPARPNIAGDELWSNQFMLGADATAYTVVVANNGDLYVGGEFTHLAGISANRIAHWSASTNQWSALGNGLNGAAFALAISGNYLYVGGAFSSAGGAPANAIARWNVITGGWSNMGSGMAHAGANPAVQALAIDGGGNVYAGGAFDSAGGVSSQNIAKWNGGNWVAAGGLGTSSDQVDALAISGNDIYAGGTFLIPWAYVAHSSNGTIWTSLGGGANGPVYALAIYGSNVYVGGQFTTVTDLTAKSANNIAVWRASAWSALGAGLDGAALNLAVDAGGHVFAGGLFTHAGGTDFIHSAKRVAAWDGSAWSNLPSAPTVLNGVDNWAYALAISGNDVYVVGGFTQAGGRPANYLARWNAIDRQWYSPGNTVNGPIYAVLVSGKEVYLGGDFTSAGGVTANSLARWNSDTNIWSALGSGVGGSNSPLSSATQVFALAMNGNELYVGGNFKTAGGLANANNIGRWDTQAQSWATLDGGVAGCNGVGCGPFVWTLVPDGAGVDVGGSFVNAGANTANNVVLWTGSAWRTFTGVTDVTTGTDGPVYAIAPDGFGDFYIGGKFTSPRTNFVFFDFDTWNSAQSPPNDSVQSIVVVGNDVYIGGVFTNAAGSGANYVAVSRDGSDWQPLGASVNNFVRKLAQQGNTLFAGGAFTQTGALGVNNIASWDIQGQTWSNLGSGTDGALWGLTTDANFVYAGGEFANAGGKPERGLARWGQFRVDLALVRK